MDAGVGDLDSFNELYECSSYVAKMGGVTYEIHHTP